jgi:hypothetical protein
MDFNVDVLKKVSALNFAFIVVVVVVIILHVFCCVCVCVCVCAVRVKCLLYKCTPPLLFRSSFSFREVSVQCAFKLSHEN